MNKLASFRKATALALLPAFLATFGGGAARLSAAAPQSPLQIDHDPLACVTPRECPRVEAAVAPGQVFQKSYVYFKAAQTEDFYYVLMNGEPQSLAGVLPRPLPETPAIDYYLRAVDREELSKKTPDYLPPVVPTEGVCKARGVPIAAGAAGAGLTIGLTREDQDPVPAGFNRNDVAKVILVSGAVVTVAEALKLRGQTKTSKKSSGATAALIVGGAVVVGAAVAIAANNRGGGSPGNPSLTITASATSGQAPLTVTFSAPVQGGRSPFSFSWMFGDGGTSTLQNPVHTYQAPGTYLATVTVTDSRGRTAAANLTITVSGPPPLNFFEADANWSGATDVDINIVNSGGATVGQAFRVGCGPTESRGEHVVLQGASLIPGTYAVTLTGISCGAASPPTVTAVVSIETDQGPVASCSNVVSTVSVGQTLTVCTFAVP